MSFSPFKRVLIANRGEIAVRVIRACEKLGIETVVAVSEADRDTMAAQLADRAVCIGPATARDSYLNPLAIVAAAKGTGCEAIHPGYGFLSERAHFARLCGENDVTFIGPSPEAIEQMGDKLAAIRIAEAAGVPRVPGSGLIASPADAEAFAAKVGYPVLVKASAGGGGRGMRVVRRHAELASSITAAAAEAQAAFGDPSIYMEKFVERARHIEIQVLGDGHGNVVHLFERDCSTQRRHQKLIEEAPSPAISEKVRSELAEAAVRLARRVHYKGAGTVEFVYDVDTERWYFLEMNTRIQVEHPVTEMVTGRDLVAEMIAIAAGAPISFKQQDVTITGHSIECRVNAEDPARNFMPGPGDITGWSPPEGEGIRIDTHCYPGYRVPPYYDSLLAKVIATGRDRGEAIQRMLDALARFEIAGVPTTIPLHREVLAHADFRSSRVTTRWVEEHFMAASRAKEKGA